MAFLCSEACGVSQNDKTSMQRRLPPEIYVLWPEMLFVTMALNDLLGLMSKNWPREDLAVTCLPS